MEFIIYEATFREEDQSTIPWELSGERKGNAIAGSKAATSLNCSGVTVPLPVKMVLLDETLRN
jgi:hypothetical protein